MHAAFYAAAHEKPHVLGLRQSEFTVGHARLLWEIQSPYMTYEREPSLGDLILAAFICHHGKAVQSKEFLFKWWFPFFLKFWGWRMAKQNLIDQAEIFELYLADARQRPTLDPFKHASRGEATCPPIYQLISVLMQRLNQPLSEIDRMPMRLANSLYHVWGDMNGTLQLASDRQLSFLEYARKQDQAKFGKEERN
jgi:hypothetical protein